MRTYKIEVVVETDDSDNSCELLTLQRLAKYGYVKLSFGLLYMNQKDMIKSVEVSEMPDGADAEKEAEALREVARVKAISTAANIIRTLSSHKKVFEASYGLSEITITADCYAIRDLINGVKVINRGMLSAIRLQW